MGKCCLDWNHRLKCINSCIPGREFENWAWSGTYKCSISCTASCSKYQSGCWHCSCISSSTSVSTVWTTGASSFCPPVKCRHCRLGWQWLAEWLVIRVSCYPVLNLLGWCSLLTTSHVCTISIRCLAHYRTINVPLRAAAACLLPWDVHTHVVYLFHDQYQ